MLALKLLRIPRNYGNAAEHHNLTLFWRDRRQGTSRLSLEKCLLVAICQYYCSGPGVRNRDTCHMVAGGGAVVGQKSGLSMELGRYRHAEVKILITCVCKSRMFEC